MRKPMTAVLIAGLGLMSASRLAAQPFTTLYNFTGFNDGAFPFAGLILLGTNFYGTASEAGSGFDFPAIGTGTVFKVSTNGMVFTTLRGFTPVTSGSNSGGSTPVAGLVLSGANLYGTTEYGGGSNQGVVFAVGTNGTGFTNLHSFRGSAGNDGAEPEAGLILSGTNLYGTTEMGGAFNQGTIFIGGTNGAGFTNLYNFTGGNDGANPMAGLILSGANFYGTANAGGSSGFGTVFAVSTNGMVFTNLHSFTGGNDGGAPAAGLILSGGALYGTTTTGGSGGNGTIFAVNTNGTEIAVLHSFTAMSNTGTNSDGATPSAGLILSGNILYGTASVGGSGGNGTVFQINTDGTSFIVLHSFTALNENFTNSDGAMPYAGLILSGGILYGTASAGGSSDDGTIFSFAAPPQLAIVLSGANVILTWTNPAPRFILQFTTNLSPAAWYTNLPAPVVINGRNTVTNAISGTHQFYRLGQ
jgi:uncharacterized repeat protein (TIGR03803 family)